jgi:hypothetical protein
MLPTQAATGLDTKAGVVAFDDDKDVPEDTVTASPFDSERVLETVLFARARVDGAPATVVIRAHLGMGVSGAFADHAKAEVRIYRLENPGVEVGTTPDVFHLIATVRPTGRFCNADMALHTVLGLPLPPDYAGGKAPDGCF